MTAFPITNQGEDFLNQAQLIRLYGRPVKLNDGCNHQCTRCAVVFRCDYDSTRYEISLIAETRFTTANVGLARRSNPLYDLNMDI